MHLSEGIFGKIVARVGPPILAGVLFAIDYSISWKLTFLTKEDDVRQALKNPVIFAFWHNQQLMMLFTYRRFFRKLEAEERKIYTLSSRHRDGRLIANILGYFGIHNLAGSSSRGQLAAVRGMIRSLQQGHHVGITPDGPRGPPYQAKRGLVEVARRANSTVIPIGLAASRKWEFKSWDKMFLPKPFCTAQVVFGRPITVDELAIPEAHRDLTDEMNLAWETAQKLLKAEEK